MPSIGITRVGAVFVGGEPDGVEGHKETQDIIEHMKTVCDQGEGSNGVTHYEFDEEEDDVDGQQDRYPRCPRKPHVERGQDKKRRSDADDKARYHYIIRSHARVSARRIHLSLKHKMTAAPSMAAALAASLPAPAAVSAPSQPTYESIPPSMAKVVDIEAEIPLSAVQLDGMVVTKIIKHAREASPTMAHGLLLGLDLDGVLEVSNSFPLPSHSGEDDEKSAKSTARIQASMLRSLKEVQADDSVIGFYQATTLGAFFNQTLVDTQAIHQEKLRHGGIVVVHDVSQTMRGNPSFRAFRLTAAFMEAYKKSNFSTNSLINHSLTFSRSLEEVPLKIRTNPLLTAFLGTMAEPAPLSATALKGGTGSVDGLRPSFSVLDLNTGGTTRNLEQIVEAIDNYRTEEGNVSYLTRQITRERAKAENYIAKRKEENQARVAQGLVPLPEEDVSRLFKIPAEPSRLDSLLLLGQIDALGKSLEGTAGTGLVKMYGVQPHA